MNPLHLVVCLAVAAAALHGTPSAQQLYREGRRLEKQGKLVEAYLLYAEAAASEPANRKYWQRSRALRTQAVLAANTLPPPAAPSAGAPASDPAAEPAPEPTPAELAEARKPKPPLSLQTDPGTRSLDLRVNAQNLFEEIAKACKLDVVFDGDYQPGPVVRFQLRDVTCDQALYAAQTVTASFIVPIAPRLFMVVKDNPAKRTEVENAIAITIPIPNTVTIQETQELARSVQQMMELPKFAIDSNRRLVFIRGPVSKVQPARELFAELLYRTPQVYLEVEVLNFARGSSSSYGMDLPNTFPLAGFADFGPFWQRSIPTGVTNWFGFGGGLTFIGIGIANPSLFARGDRSDMRSLLRTELRSGDGQPATFHVGEKYPIITTEFVTSDRTTQDFAPPPLFQFEDLGLTLKVTPRVHGSREVTLEVEAEYKTLAGTGYNGIPVISTRKSANRVRLSFGEAAVIAGLITSTEARTLSGIAGLAQVPMLGTLTSSNTRRREEAETMIVIRPRLLAAGPSELATRGIWTGSESRPRVPL
ncbi:MAG TPA: type II and III secretion system protein [Bryobacteraceae bacterium]|nr:type II and III secretion system protein [Bryobacteraceae bacterium]